MQNDFTIELKNLIFEYINDDGIFICNNAGITTLRPENYTSDDLIVLRHGCNFGIYKGDNIFLHTTLKNLIAPLLLATLNKFDFYNANTNEIKNALNKLLEFINKNDNKSIYLDFTKFDTYDNEKLASYWIKILKELYDSVNFAKRLNLLEEIEFWKCFSEKLTIVDEHKKSKSCANCLVDLEKKGKIIFKTTLELYFDTSKYVKLTKIILDNLKELNLNIDDLDCLTFFNQTTKNFQYINNYPKIIYKICQNHLENYIIEIIKKIKEYIISSKNNIDIIFENMKDYKISIQNDLFLTFCTDFEKLYEDIEFLNEISKVNLKNINTFDVNKLIDDFIKDTKFYVIEFDLYKNKTLDLVCIYINNQKSDIELYFRFFYFTKYEFVLKNTIDKRHEELEKIEIHLENFLCDKDIKDDFLIISKYLKKN
ncbi:hypothetical protein GVAV_003017 [Gurleya vavrai]